MKLLTKSSATLFSIAAGLVVMSCGTRAEARSEFREFRQNNPEIARHQARLLFKSQAREASVLPIPTTQTLNSLPRVGLNERNARHVQRLSDRLEQRLSTQIGHVLLSQQAASLSDYVLNLDLSSADQNVTLPTALFRNGRTITIESGGQAKTFSAGDSVTAAQFIAIQQERSGRQSIEIDASGRAVGGSFSLKTLTSDGGIKIGDVTIPSNVVAQDKITAHTQIQITGDLNNYGTISETLLGKRSLSQIGADDITNHAGASILAVGNRERSSGLTLIAQGELLNEGTISSSSSLRLASPRSISNSGSGGVISAGEDLLLEASAVQNNGLIRSDRGNVITTFSQDSVGDARFDNAGGTVRASNGDIILDGTGIGPGTVRVDGGDFFSRNVFLRAGSGTLNMDVNNLTGSVVSDGAAVHVKASTDTLVLGNQNLCGDPTYYNDSGDIIISGNISVGEALAIIASGNISATNAVSSITTSGAQGYDINIVAGANVTGLNTDTTNSIPGTAATGDVSLTGASTTGGNVDFSAADSNLLISSNSTSSDNAGGNITIAAFSGTGGGNVLLPASSNIDASGSGTGSFGDVTIVARNSIVVGSVSHGGTAGANDIDVIASQPVISDGGSLVFATNGSISSGNSLEGTTLGNVVATVQTGDLRSLGGAINVVSATAVLGNLDATGGSSNSSAGLVKLDLSAFSEFSVGTATSNSVLSINVSGGSVSGDAGEIFVSNVASGGSFLVGSVAVSPNGLIYDVTDGDGARISLTSGTVLTLPGGTFDVSGGGSSGNGGEIHLAARQRLEWSNSDVSPLILRANGSGVGDGGVVDYHTLTIFPEVTDDVTLGFGAGQISLEATSGSSGGNGGTATLRNIGTLLVDGSAVNVSPLGLNGNGGSIDFQAAGLATENMSHVVLQASGVGIGNGGSINLRSQVFPLTIGTDSGQFELFAEGGNVQGNGGTIYLSNSFNLTAFTDAIHANPTGANGDGASISIVAGMINSFRVIGDLVADGVGSGIGGNVLLSSGAVGFMNNKEFQIGKSGTQNGITGSISVKGSTNGSVFIESNGPISQYVDLVDVDSVDYRSRGQINITKNLGDSATSQISLRSFTAGDIVSRKPIEADMITLQTAGGNIGTNKALSVSTASLSATGASVNIRNSSGDTVSLGVSASQSGAFKFSSDGNIATVGAITGATSVELTSEGKASNIVVGDVISTDLSSGVVSLNTKGGSISNASAGLDSIQAFQVDLDSKDGDVGSSANPLRLTTTNISSKGKGSVSLRNFNGVETHLLSVKSRGDVSLASDGSIFVDEKLNSASAIALSTIANNGGIELNASIGSNKAQSIVLDVFGSGDITQSSSKVRLTANSIELYSDSGNIGSASTPLSLNSGALTVNNAGSPGGTVNISELSKTVELLDSTASGSFSLTSAGSLFINNLSAAQISIRAGGGLLRVESGATVETSAGGISLSNAGKSKSTKIEIGSSANILSMDAPGGGEIDIFIGELPATSSAGSTPTNVTVTTPGTVFFNNGITALAPNNSLSAINTQLVFSTGKLAASAIQLDGGVTIIADPPATVAPAYFSRVNSSSPVEMMWSSR